MLKIHCSGLSLDEIKELQALLKTQNGVADVQYQPDFSGIQSRSSTMGFVTPEFWVSINVAVAALAVTGAITGKSLLEEAGKDAYKVAKGWIGRKRSDNKMRDITVELYDYDGKLIEKIDRQRP